jgi:hypothetical protein
MIFEFCPQCEQEEAQAKWKDIGERSGTKSDVGPCGIYAPV